MDPTSQGELRLPIYNASDVSGYFCFTVSLGTFMLSLIFVAFYTAACSMAAVRQSQFINLDVKPLRSNFGSKYPSSKVQKIKTDQMTPDFKA